MSKTEWKLWFTKVNALRKAMIATLFNVDYDLKKPDMIEKAGKKVFSDDYKNPSK